MISMAKDFLTLEEQNRINEAVQKAEQKTSGEIVPMIVSQSHHYPLAILTGAFLLAAPSAIILTTLFAPMVGLASSNMWFFILLTLLLFPILLYTVGNIPSFKARFLWISQVEEEVQEGAVNAFYTEGLHRTRDENGILLYISVFERKVWILADRGINEKINPQLWEKIVADLSSGFKANQRCLAICNAVEEVGSILEKSFPIKEDDKNELHNLIIRD